MDSIKYKSKHKLQTVNNIVWKGETFASVRNIQFKNYQNQRKEFKNCA